MNYLLYYYPTIAFNKNSLHPSHSTFGIGFILPFSEQVSIFLFNIKKLIHVYECSTCIAEICCFHNYSSLSFDLILHSMSLSDMCIYNFETTASRCIIIHQNGATITKRIK